MMLYLIGFSATLAGIWHPLWVGAVQACDCLIESATAKALSIAMLYGDA